MNILIIRTCAIGDFVLNLPALRALQKAYPKATFTLAGYPSTLELARDFINVQAIHSMETAPWNRLFYEAIPGLTANRAIVWMKDPSVADNLKASGVAAVLRADPFPASGHAARHLLESVELPTPDLPDLWKGGGPLVLHPGSGGVRKCWPHFRELADRLESPLFLLGPGEQDWDTGVHRRLEGLSLREVSAVLSTARGYIGNDSGITHLAGYIGCPAVAIFGPTDPHVWGPLGRRVRIVNWPSVEEAVIEAAFQAREWPSPSSPCETP